ncbi:MAG: PPC domain-containing protein [Kofleriaceae bacterium]
MSRESWSAVAIAIAATCSAGCSLILDFSDGAVPSDASIDSKFSQAECDFGEPNDTAGAATVLAAGTSAAAVCASGFDDHDFYKITVPAATAKLTVTINFTSSATGDLDLRLLDAAGTIVHSSSVGFGDIEQITCPGVSPTCTLGSTPPVPEGDYLVEVFPAVTGAQNRYDIAFELMPQ